MNKKAYFSSQRGFTLIEILVVIGIIAILAGIVLIAINPARQFKQARDTQRVSNVNAILNAIGQYIADNKGDLSGLDLPASGDTEEIDSTESDLCSDLIPTYIPALPVEPDIDPDGAGPLGKGGAIKTCPTNYESGYQIERDTNDRITISASHTELASPDISVTR